MIILILNGDLIRVEQGGLSIFLEEPRLKQPAIVLEQKEIFCNMSDPLYLAAEPFETFWFTHFLAKHTGLAHSDKMLLVVFGKLPSSLAQQPRDLKRAVK